GAAHLRNLARPRRHPSSRATLGALGALETLTIGVASPSAHLESPSEYPASAVSRLTSRSARRTFDAGLEPHPDTEFEREGRGSLPSEHCAPRNQSNQVVSGQG